MSLIQYVSLNETATATEQTASVDVKSILLVANDSTTVDLHVSFGGSFSEGNYMVLKPGEQLVNMDTISCDDLYYKSSSSTFAFRFIGLTGKGAIG